MQPPFFCWNFRETTLGSVQKLSENARDRKRWVEEGEREKDEEKSFAFSFINSSQKAQTE